jgi:hypothetical protein
MALAKVLKYTGTGANQTITGVGFQPDFILIKRISTAGAFMLAFDIKRNLGDYYQIFEPSALGTNTASAISVTGYNSDGFTIGTLATINTAGATYVAMCFKELAGFFDLATWTGNGGTSVVSHALGVAPNFFFTHIANLFNYTCGYVDFISPTLCTVLLDGTPYGTNANNTWGGTAATSTQFSTTQTALNNNANASPYIAYMWASLTGQSSIGSYTGDGNANKTTQITCGFQPAFVILKRMDNTGTGEWIVFDDANNTGGSPFMNRWYMTNSAALGADANGCIITSTGFRPPLSANVNTAPYLYMAFNAAGSSGGGGVPGFPSKGRGPPLFTKGLGRP